MVVGRNADTTTAGGGDRNNSIPSTCTGNVTGTERPTYYIEIISKKSLKS